MNMRKKVALASTVRCQWAPSMSKVPDYAHVTAQSCTLRNHSATLHTRVAARLHPAVEGQKQAQSGASLDGVVHPAAGTGVLYSAGSTGELL